MSKAVLISIKPKWCEKIANGEKVIEVRKTKPNIATPFKCYIYQTKMKLTSNIAIAVSEVQGCGKVIGEFICDKIDKYTLAYGFGEKENKDSKYGSINDYAYNIHDSVYRAMCLTEEKFYNYLKGEVGYGYHITELKIYDKPKDLSEFMVYTKKGKSEVCQDCKHQKMSMCMIDCDCISRLTRPPQSYMFVDDLGE